MARSRVRARLNWVSQGQRCGRCRVRRRAERVSRPARAKTRRLSWALHISSGVGKRIDKSVVQGGRDFPYIRVGGGQ